MHPGGDIGEGLGRSDQEPGKGLELVEGASRCNAPLLEENRLELDGPIHPSDGPGSFYVYEEH